MKYDSEFTHECPSIEQYNKTIESAERLFLNQNHRQRMIQQSFATLCYCTWGGNHCNCWARYGSSWNSALAIIDHRAWRWSTVLTSLWPFDKPVQNGFKCRGLINCLDHATATESNDEFPELLYSLLQAIFDSLTANPHKVKLEPII
jgi:hypothetical protein